MAILTQIGQALRGTAKGVIKGGIVLTNTASGFAAEARKEFSDLVKEARTEVNNIHAARINHPKVESEGLGDHLMRMGHAVWEGASQIASMANAELVAMIAWCTGESKQKAEKQVEKAEGFVKRGALELTELESANVIEMLLLSAA